MWNYSTCKLIWFIFDTFKIWSCLASLVGPVYIIDWNNNLAHIYGLVSYSFDWFLPFAFQGAEGEKIQSDTEPLFSPQQ